MRNGVSGLTLVVLGLSACASVPAAVPAARATISDASGKVVAQATLRQAGTGLAVHVEARGLAPGTYGIHIHGVGRCEGPAFASAGGHWNPTAHQHGRDNPAGPHSGDLPNLGVSTDGRGGIDFAVPGALLNDGGANALLDADGAAIVIHAQADDYRTDPSGNSGARIACGVVAAG